MLNSKTVRLDGAGGGIPTLTADDINAATSFCNPTGLNMLKVRICGDDSEAHTAYKAIYNDVQKIAKRWRSTEKEARIKALVQLAMFEANKTPVCPACKGRKFNRFHKPCTPCKATGKYIIRNSLRARALNVSHSNYTRVWERRLTEVLQLISDKESQALTQLSKRIGH
jgi:hypothetical protein